VRVLISGYYGFGNVGDEAVLKAIIGGLREQAPAIGLTVLSANPALTTELNEVRSVHRYDLWGVLSELDGAGVFLSGGGTLFQNATSSRSFWYYLGLTALALLFGKKVMVFAQGFGPLRGRVNRAAARWVLDRVHLITLRDQDSYDELKKLGVRNPHVYVTADPTFCLQNSGPAEGRKLLGLEGVPVGKPLVGVALRSLGRWPGDEKEFVKLLAGLLDKLKTKHGFEPVFLLFQCPEDMSETKKVYDSMKERGHIVFKILRPEEMLSLFAGFRFVIGMRLHALVFAAENGVPFLALSYDPKVAAFAKAVGQPYLDLAEIGRLEAVMEQTKPLAVAREELVVQARRNFELFFETFGKTN